MAISQTALSRIVALEAAFLPARPHQHANISVYGLGGPWSDADLAAVVAASPPCACRRPESDVYLLWHSGSDYHAQVGDGPTWGEGELFHARH